MLAWGLRNSTYMLFDADIWVSLLLGVSVSIGLALNAEGRHGSCQQRGHESIVHLHLREEAKVGNRQKTSAPEKDCAFHKISDTVALFFFMGLIMVSHCVTELPY